VATKLGGTGEKLGRGTLCPPPRLGRKTTTANISLSQMSSKLVPQPRTCSSKTSLSVAAAGLFDADDEADDDFDT